MIRVSEEPFDPGAELTAFERAADGAGAVASFTGKVRARAASGAVNTLYLEHYPGLTEKSIAAIEAEARERWALEHVNIIHRIGRLNPGDPIVMVCVSSAHRRDAFEAADFLMDYLKTEALFWKKEITSGDEAWIEPRDQDYQDAARWRKEK